MRVSLLHERRFHSVLKRVVPRRAQSRFFSRASSSTYRRLFVRSRVCGVAVELLIIRDSEFRESAPSSGELRSTPSTKPQRSRHGGRIIGKRLPTKAASISHNACSPCPYPYEVLIPALSWDAEPQPNPERRVCFIAEPSGPTHGRTGSGGLGLHQRRAPFTSGMFAEPG